MTYQEFKNKYSDKGIDFDGYYGFQCMDLAHQYAVEVIGHDIPNGNAKDMWDYDIEGYNKIVNTPEAVPQQGDIIIWGQGIGAFGHIAVFDNGDQNKFQSFDQNWPLNSLCHLQNHNYTGVLGWFHPKNQQGGDDSMNIKKAVQFDKITSFLNSISVIPTEHSEDYVDDDKLLVAVQNLSAENQRKAEEIKQLKQELNTATNTPTTEEKPSMPTVESQNGILQRLSNFLAKLGF